MSRIRTLTRQLENIKAKVGIERRKRGITAAEPAFQKSIQLGFGGCESLGCVGRQGPVVDDDGEFATAEFEFAGKFLLQKPGHMRGRTQGLAQPVAIGAGQRRFAPVEQAPAIGGVVEGIIGLNADQNHSGAGRNVQQLGHVHEHLGQGLLRHPAVENIHDIGRIDLQIALDKNLCDKIL